MRVSGLAGVECAVLCDLAVYAKKDGTCFPTAARIAKGVGFSVRRVKAALAALEGAGWLLDGFTWRGARCRPAPRTCPPTGPGAWLSARAWAGIEGDPSVRHRGLLASLLVRRGMGLANV
jgi:hypothetical protein